MCAIVIPMYKSQLDEREEIALKQVRKVLNNYDIIAILPNSLMFQEDLFTKVERFDDNYFHGISSYNCLMLSPEFYQRFQEYEYILIYQLDAFVFFDKLSYFCSLGYDYIGAPWLHGVFYYMDDEHCIWNVGNGGLSLRKVKSFIEIVEKECPLKEQVVKNEDLIFSTIVDERFQIAPVEIALQFAFERQVRECYKLNHEQLPFGCHAWERYDFDFWRPYIEKEGYRLKIDRKCTQEDACRVKEYDCYTRFSNFFENGYNVERAEEVLRKMMKEHLNSFVLFGAGFYGKAITKWFTSLNLPIKGICDNNNELWGKEIEGCFIFGIEELEMVKDESYIVISNLEHESDIAKQLESKGFTRGETYITFTDFVEILYLG